MLDSCRGSIHKQYQSAWKAWDSWCHEQLLNPLSAPVKEVLEFLVNCERKGLSYRTLGVYRSVFTVSVGLHVCESVIQIMKGFFNRNPPKLRGMGCEVSACFFFHI